MPKVIESTLVSARTLAAGVIVATYERAPAIGDRENRELEV